MTIEPRFPPLKLIFRSCAIRIKCILGLRRTLVPHVIVFTFRVKCCDIRYDFCLKNMFNSSFPPVVCRRLISYLRYCVCFRIVVSSTYCVAFLLCFSSSCVHPMSPVSLLLLLEPKRQLAAISR
jgi:hypothetical protein